MDEPRMKMASAELVCMTPQDVLFDPLPVLFADNNSEVAPARVETTTDNISTRVQQASQHASDKSVLDLSSLAMTQSLVEAIPNYRSNPLPEYPFLARQKHWEGVVWLLVDITAEGLVDDLRVEQPCGHRVLDRAASRTVRRWQFSPATRAGVPVASQVRVPVRFRLEDG
ncbi:MAG: energy transducer TonB [Deltaproteobacteria bacterium]|nr:energy transducer TonB [Deltaproteobacteria bacterium]